jgi:tetratricopeptide (TPR) repeat protein
MAARFLRSLAAIALGGFASAFFAQPAAAQTGTFYTPPKLIKQGTATSAVASNGAVTVQVFIKKDGSVGAVKVQKSTNPADNAAALEIAKSSTYKPGERDAKPIDAYYTMALKFNGSSVVNDTGTTANQLMAANALVRAAKYAEAKAQIDEYLGSHAGDKDAEALLGVADSYLNDNAGSAAAFDAAGTIPDRFKLVAAKAYSDAAVDQLKAKNNDQAVALASKSLALQESVNSLYLRGTAYANAQKYPQAIGDLEKARSMAAAGKAEQSTLNAIDAGLATSYMFGGQADKGLALAKELKRRDPSNTRIDDTLAAYYSRQASDAIKAGNRTLAVTSLENAAAAVPSRAGAMYVQAANVLSQGDKPDWKAVKAEADKALALDPNDARANFVAGIALANQGDAKNAIVLLQKAKAAAGADTDLNTNIDTALKKLQTKQ